MRRIAVREGTRTYAAARRRCRVVTATATSLGRVQQAQQHVHTFSEFKLFLPLTININEIMIAKLLKTLITLLSEP